MAFELGECRLRDILKTRNIKPVDFARKMKCTRQYINDLMTNRATMSLIFSINASFILDCSPQDFYKLVPRKRQE